MSGVILDDLHQAWLKRPAYKVEYEALGEAFAVASALIEARALAGLSQAQVADRMQTTQTVIARLESGRGEAFDADFGAVCGGDGVATADCVGAGGWGVGSGGVFRRFSC